MAQGEQTPHLRWFPHLCALTGARPSELRRFCEKDVQREDGAWFINLPWDAGSLKNQSSDRCVPLRAALKHQGSSVLRMAAEAASCLVSSRPIGSEIGVGREKRRIGIWVNRQVDLKDQRISPTHGWRHSFNTLCRRRGIGVDFHDALTGHSCANEAAAYRELPLDASRVRLTNRPTHAGLATCWTGFNLADDRVNFRRLAVRCRRKGRSGRFG